MAYPHSLLVSLVFVLFLHYCTRVTTANSSGCDIPSVEDRTDNAAIIAKGKVLRTLEPREYDGTLPVDVVMTEVYKGYAQFMNVSAIRLTAPHGGVTNVYRLGGFPSRVRPCLRQPEARVEYIFFMTIGKRPAPEEGDQQLLALAGEGPEKGTPAGRGSTVLELRPDYDSMVGKPLEVFTTNKEEDVLTYLGWTKWSTWSRCNQLCNGGTQSRTRQCVEDDDQAMACEGDHQEMRSCNKFQCTEMVDLVNRMELGEEEKLKFTKKRLTAYFIPLGTSISIANRMVYTSIFPAEFSILLVLKPRPVGSRLDDSQLYPLVIVDSEQRLEMAIEIGRHASIVYGRSDGRPVGRVTFSDYSLNRKNWHYLAFGIRGSMVTMIAGCSQKSVHHLPDGDEISVDIDGTMSIGEPDGGVQELDEVSFAGDIEQFVIVGDADAAALQCSSPERMLSLPPEDLFDSYQTDSRGGDVPFEFNPNLVNPGRTITPYPPQHFPFPSSTSTEVPFDPEYLPSTMEAERDYPTEKPVIKTTKMITNTPQRTTTPASTTTLPTQPKTTTTTTPKAPTEQKTTTFRSPTTASTEAPTVRKTTTTAFPETPTEQKTTSRKPTEAPEDNAIPEVDKNTVDDDLVNVIPSGGNHPDVIVPQEIKKPPTTEPSREVAATPSPKVVAPKMTITKPEKPTTIVGLPAELPEENMDDMAAEEKPPGDDYLGDDGNLFGGGEAGSGDEDEGAYNEGGIDWSTWSPCTTSCGVGTRYRFGFCQEDSANYDCQRGHTITSQRRKCKLYSCPGAMQWSEWGLCSQSCGEGAIQTRMAFCPDESAHPDCLRPGQVVADRRDCDVPACEDVCDIECENGGACNGGVCICPPGYRGDYCQHQTCSPQCKNGGVCISNNLCSCPVDTDPPFCTRRCVPECHNGAQCVAGNTCECLDGYQGTRCQSPICNNICQNGGRCIGPDKCQCPNGYGGPTCNQAQCLLGCDNGGECIRPEYCRCPPAYRGARCEIAYCRERCRNGGTCVGADRCKCPRAFAGAFCQKSKCPRGCPSSMTCVGVNRCVPISFAGRQNDRKGNNGGSGRRKTCFPLVSYNQRIQTSYIKPVIRNIQISCGTFGLQTCNSQRLDYTVAYRTTYKTSYRCGGSG